MLFTIAHELTHFIRQWSPAKFKVLVNFLVKQYGEKGVTVSELVNRQMDKAKRNGRSLTWEEAYEEMVADSMETMLTDGNVVQVMADLKQLLVAIEADVMMDREPVNVIRSVYGLDNPQEWLQNQMEEGKNFVMYNEKGANSFLQTYGYSASVGEGIKPLGDSIHTGGSVVKEKFSLREPEADKINGILRQEKP